MENYNDYSFYTGVFDTIDKEGDDKTSLLGIQHNNTNLFRDTFLGKLSPISSPLVLSESNDIKSEVTSKPFPSTCGKESAINPTQSPPKQVLKGTGIPLIFSILSSTKFINFIKTEAAKPTIKPRII